MMENILELNHDNFMIFLTGDDNFRYKIYPEYKANRKGAEKPAWLPSCYKHLVGVYGARYCNGYEADDGIGINATGDHCVVSIDKDLRQIAGGYYHFVNGTYENITEFDAAKHLYTQLLTGDNADNIPGLPRVGPKTAERFLAGINTELGLLERCTFLYRERGIDNSELLLRLRLLRILRSEEEYFRILSEIETEQREGQGEESSESSSDSDPGGVFTINPR